MNIYIYMCVCVFSNEINYHLPRALCEITHFHMLSTRTYQEREKSYAVASDGQCTYVIVAKTSARSTAPRSPSVVREWEKSG